MRIIKAFLPMRITVAVLTVVAMAWFVFTARVAAQCTGTTCGYNAVFNSSSVVTPSASFIDASVAAFTTSDFCAQIYNALWFAQGLSPQPSSVVIDARGVNTHPSASCASGSTPWAQPTKQSITIPSTILLPSGIVTISTAWVLPDRTRVVGLGKTQTMLTAAANFQLSNSTMLQMCSSVCTGVSVTDLLLEGNGQAGFNGITNHNAQEFSYVQGVTVNQVEGTGLDIETSGANNSGPYTDLNITAGGTKCGTACQEDPVLTACVRIVSASTRGIHGITCTANGTPNAGIYLDSSNNTIEDAHFEGVVDGIRVGENAAAAGNVIANIAGATGGNGGTSGIQHNVVHICGANPATTFSCAPTFHVVTDLILLQIKTDDQFHDAILDDITGAELGSSTGNFSVAQYVRGQPLAIGTSTGYSLLTTAASTVSSPTPTPDWGQGLLGNTGTPSTPCATGAIFSNATSTATTGHVIWVCAGGAWTLVK